MYFSNKNNFYHGIMFHHFHDGNLHKKGQGSMDKDDLCKLVKFVGRKNILNANDFFIRYKENKLTEKDLCFTFDDGIRCQFDIALPVLEDLKIKSFFFVYSSLFKGKPDFLEIYRYFRMNYFEDVDEFYSLFFKKVDKDLTAFYIDKGQLIRTRKIKFPHYSINDIKFRLVRDNLLEHNDYKEVMFEMFKEKEFQPEDFFQTLFMTNEHLIKIRELGHIIGLHSHTHPTLIEKLTFHEQLKEYKNNVAILSEILKRDKKEIKCMSHPCGSYNQDTLKILDDLGIELGFKQIMTIEKERGMKKINGSNLEIARQDHAEVMRMMN